jgi:hypothetical protein
MKRPRVPERLAVIDKMLDERQRELQPPPSPRPEDKVELPAQLMEQFQHVSTDLEREARWAWWPAVMIYFEHIGKIYIKHNGQWVQPIEGTWHTLEEMRELTRGRRLGEIELTLKGYLG